jgi:hypothetical protein
MFRLARFPRLLSCDRSYAAFLCSFQGCLRANLDVRTARKGIAPSAFGLVERRIGLLN